MPAVVKCGNSIDDHISETQVRIFFWVAALILAAINAYTSRFFINNDAIAYLEIGEAIKQFNWYDAANFTFSPLYGLLLALFQSLLQLNPFNEILWAKLLNYLIFIVTIGALEIFLRLFKRDYMAAVNSGERPLNWIWVQTLLYSVFLVTSLVSIRLRLINPDMLVFCLILLILAVVMWIRKNPTSHFKFALLGILLGLGYMAKAFMFLLAPLFLLMAAFCVGSLRKSITRITVAMLFFLIITGPLLTELYLKKGSFSYGEGGRHVYTKLIGGQGAPVHQGKILQNEPRIVVYDYGAICTRPFTFDVTYWTIGIDPKYNYSAHFKLFLQNLLEIPAQSHWILAILIWALFQIYLGSFVIGRACPVSLQILFLLTSLSGMFLFAMISMEPRYVAPSLFVGSAGLISGMRQGKNKKVFWKLGMSELGILALVLFLLGAVLEYTLDEAKRGLSFHDGKSSYQKAYSDEIRVSQFLAKHGVVPGNRVAVVGSPPIQWARMARVRVTGEIEDADKFLDSPRADRSMYMTLLKNEGIGAVIAQGKELQKLAGEGWLHVPGD